MNENINDVSSENMKGRKYFIDSIMEWHKCTEKEAYEEYIKGYVSDPEKYEKLTQDQKYIVDQVNKIENLAKNAMNAYLDFYTLFDPKCKEHSSELTHSLKYSILYNIIEDIMNDGGYLGEDYTDYQYILRSMGTWYKLLEHSEHWYKQMCFHVALMRECLNRRIKNINTFQSLVNQLRQELVNLSDALKVDINSFCKGIDINNPFSSCDCVYNCNTCDPKCSDILSVHLK
jgi:hypothetical protein